MPLFTEEEKQKLLKYHYQNIGQEVKSKKTGDINRYEQKPTGIGDEAQSLGMSPLSVLAAKAQKFMGESQALPMAGGIVGGAVMPVVGTGAGTALGELLRQGAAEQEGLRGIIPETREETGQALRKGGTAAIADLLLRFAPFPKNITRWQTNLAKGRSGISGQQYLDKLMRGARGAQVPTSQQQTVQELLERELQRTTAGQIPLDEALQMKRGAGAGFTAAGREARSAAGTFERLKGGALRGLIREQAPLVGTLDDIKSVMYKAPKLMRDLLWRAWQISVLGKAAGSL